MLVEMKGIVMDFGPVRAVDHVDFTVTPGDIIGLLGENGAGKSTLMKVLAGVYPRDAGVIEICGQPVEIHDARQAQALGISMIHQELSLMRDLTVPSSIDALSAISV